MNASNDTPAIWQRANGAGASNDLTAFGHAWALLAKQRGITTSTLGEVLGHPLWMGHRPAAQADAPRVMITAGFHGEEPAGPWGVLALLQDAPDALLDRVHLSLLPLVNCTGFAKGLRLNARGENPNRGFGAHAGNDHLSAEGALLVQHASQLLPAARDGLYCGHEHLEESHTYLYTFEPHRPPGPFSHGLIATAGQWFPVAPDGDLEGDTVVGGLVHNKYDGSFESWFSEQGTSVAVCAETPGMQPFDQRVQAQAALMAKFVQLCMDGA
jgi:hypothetical protein